MRCWGRCRAAAPIFMQNNRCKGRYLHRPVNAHGKYIPFVECTKECT